MSRPSLGGSAPASRRAVTIRLNQLIRPAALFLLAGLCLSAHPQTNEWAWMGGSSSGYGTAQYGTLGTPAAGNIPDGRFLAAIWTDSSGHLWLFGGFGYGANGFGYLNDLWEFNPSTNEWAWMGGSSTVPSYSGGQPGVYGTLGVPAAGNIPGGRCCFSSWTDSSGHLWLFGGNGFDANGIFTYFLNDLWEFKPSTNEWAWMGGSSTVPCSGCGQPGVYGTLGTPAAGNIPGGRAGSASWTDSNGNFWLFGGGGVPNDLWEFYPSTNEWAWMGGSSSGGGAAVYGTLGTPAAGNIPAGTVFAAAWTDSSGHLWLFSGNDLNDLWEYFPSTNQWAWMGGSSTLPSNGVVPGVYGTLGTPAAGNIPGGRGQASSWTDSSGHFWLFGGAGYDASGNTGNLNDLWEFNPSTKEWAWMGGSSTMSLMSNGSYGQPGVYGTLGTPGAGNVPGGRSGAASMTDSNGNLWLFGGLGYAADGIENYINDLWRYQPLPNAATPTFSLAPGTYTSVQTVSIAETTPGATIYYTLDGSTPTTASPVYSAALTVSQTTTVKAIAVAAGYSNSAVASASYIVNLPPAATPAFKPAAGTYTTIQTVKLTDATKGAAIYYTLDGSTPTTASALYSKPLTVSQTTTIEAIAVAAGYSNSAVASAAYIVNLPVADAPTFTPPAGVYGEAQRVMLASTTPNATIYYATDGATPSAGSANYTGPIEVNASETIAAIAVAIGYTNSPVASATYTLAGSPQVLTGLACDIHRHVATLNATVNGFAAPGQVWFVWGTSGAELDSKTDKSVLPASSGAQAVSAALTGLASGTTYYFRPMAETVGGISRGAVQSFTTE